MRIALDAMGGDFAPNAMIEGAILALQELSEEVKVVLVGIQEKIEAVLEEFDYSGDQLEVFHASEVIKMGEHPTKAISQKPDSSIVKGYKLLASNKVDAFCGAGNTGAMHVGAIFSIKPIEGIMRPALITHVPRGDGSTGLMLDVGANADCKPELLDQFASLGYVYAQKVLEIENPRVALMNLGEEEKKGNTQTKNAYQLLAKNPKINFVGNIEGGDLFFSNKSDVIVCDGFVGNVLLKLAESLFDLTDKKGIKDPFFDHLNYEATGGSPILGINGNVVIGHGKSSAVAVKNMLLLSYRMAKSNLTDNIKKSLFDI